MGIRETWRRYGIRWACIAGWYKVLQRLMTLDVSRFLITDLRDVPHSRMTDVTFRPLTAGEVRSHAKNSDLDLCESLADRLDCGLDYCIGAIRDGRLVAYYWLAVDSIEAAHNRGATVATGVAISFPRNMVFGYKAFVAKEARGRGIYVGLVHAAGRWACYELGARYLISTVEWTNQAALRSCRKQGLRSIGTVWRFGIGKYLFTKSPKAALNRNIRFGDSASVQCRTSTAGNVSRMLALASA